jgi:predicted MFS family arabinose efflux permease
VAAGLSLGPLVALGLARFAYAQLLPAMRADLGWSYAQAGAMSTANALGYLVGAALTATVADRLGAKRLFAGGLLATALSLLAAAFVRDYGVLLALRLAGGLAGAATFVAGSSLAATAGVGGGPRRVALMLGIYFCGPGAGIVISAPLLPALLRDEGGGDWPRGWLALGILGLVASLGALAALRRVEEPQRRRGGPGGRWSARPLLPTFVAYCLFGVGYIAYMTFIIAFLRAHGFPAQATVLFWMVIGLAAMAAGPAWTPVLARLRAGPGIFAIMLVQAIGAALPLAGDRTTTLIVSAVMFGSSLPAIGVAVTALGRRAAPPQAWTAAIGAMTVAFGIGQCIGPLVAGRLSDGPGGIRAGLLLSAVLLALGAVVGAFQREPAGRPGAT